MLWARQTISAMLSVATTMYIATTHNITHSPCTSTCTTLPIPLPSTTLACIQLTNTKHICVSDGKMAQGVGMVWKCCGIRNLVGFWGFHSYMRLFSFRLLHFSFKLGVTITLLSSTEPQEIKATLYWLSGILRRKSYVCTFSYTLPDLFTTIQSGNKTIQKSSA